MTVSYLHLGGTNYFEGAVGRGAYVVGGLGATRLAPGLSGLSAEFRPSLNLGLGYQWPIAGALSFRAELRGYFTLINSSGGLLSMGHPIGPTGVGQIAESLWQMRREGGKRQIEKEVNLAMAHMVGAGGVCAIHLLKK